MFTTTSIVGAVVGIIYLLLKYYPGWRNKHDAEKLQKEDDEFAQALATADDIRISELLDKRVRGQKGADTTGQ